MVVPSMWMETMQIVARHMTVPIGSEVLCIKNSLLMRISMLVLQRSDTISGKTGCSQEYSLDEILVFQLHSVGDSAIRIRTMIFGNNNEIMLTYILQLDQFLILKFGELHNSYIDVIMIMLTKLWDFWFLWIFLTIFLIFQSKYRHIGYILLVWLTVDILLWEGILKHIFHRERPFQELSDITLLIPEPITSSFPSGHSSASWCFAIIFTYFFWKKSRWSVLYIWIFAIGITISRLYLQVHYLSDIFAGICIGIISAFIAILIHSYRSRQSIL